MWYVDPGCLAPERVGFGSARTALPLDMDEICMWTCTKPLCGCNYSPSVLWHYGTDLWFVCVTFKDDNYGAEEVESLKSLVLNLRQLLDLHQKYNCRLSLSVFEKVWILLYVIYFKYVYASNNSGAEVCVKFWEIISNQSLLSCQDSFHWRAELITLLVYSILGCYCLKFHYLVRNVMLVCLGHHIYECCYASYILSGFSVVVPMLIIFIPCDFEREAYEMSRSSCWTKCPLQSWLQLQWRAVSCRTPKSTRFLLMSCFCSISR